MSEVETDLFLAMRRMLWNDPTLRVVRVRSTLGGGGNWETRFIEIFSCTSSPIEVLSMHNFPVWVGRQLCEALAVNGAHRVSPLRVFRLCQFFSTEFMAVEIVNALVQNHPLLERIVLQCALFSDARIAEARAAHAPFRVSNEVEAILYTVGQHAAKIIRPMLAPALYCVQSGECACTM
jgi:hypothetical protein